MTNFYKLLSLTLLLLASGVGGIKAQAVLQALPDNVYMTNGTNPMFNSFKRFNVQANDLPGECSIALHTIELEIVNPPMYGTATVVLSAGLMQIEYRVPGGIFGQDKLTYKITCSGESSTADVFINIGDIPDFIDEAECILDPPAFQWDIERKYVSDEDHYVQSYANPIAGDLDGDGVLEILALNSFSPGHWSDKVFIFDYRLNFIREISVGMINSYVTQPLAIADVDNDGEAEILVATVTGYGTNINPVDKRYRVFCYKMDGTLVWVSSEPYIIGAVPTTNGTIAGSSGYGDNRYSTSISVHDLDGDGNVEVYVGDKIFAGETGKCLVYLPQNMNAPYQTKQAGRGRREYASGPTRGFLPAVGDVDGDGKMEIVGGNTTYKIDIKNQNDTSGNKATILAQVPYTDGYTSLADIDGDGILDVVVIANPRDDNNFKTPTVAEGALNLNSTTYYPDATFMYVWQGNSGNLIGPPVVPKAGMSPPPNNVQQLYPTSGSRAFIGDINNDGKPEICFTYYCKMNAYSFNGTTFTQLWNDVAPNDHTRTTDTSGATTMSMFDFNNDGEVELVYRDETDIRILDKNGVNVKDKDGNDAIDTCYSGTHVEYPVVLDLDGDGHAEILVSGSTYYPNRNGTMRLMVYGSITPNTWSPTRQVWNQHGYTPLTINEDLSVPAHPLSPTTPLVHRDGSIHRPFNGYIMQAGVLNAEGDPLLKAYDLAFQLGKNNTLYHDQLSDELRVQCYLTNQGSITFNNKDIRLTLYSYDPATSQYTLRGGTIFSGETLLVNENREYVLTIPNYSTWSASLPADKVWYLAVNLNDNSPNAPGGFYLDQTECNEWNNLTNDLSYVSGHIVLCEGETGVLKLDPAGVYDCHWFDKNGDPYPSAADNVGDAMSVTKTGTDDEYYLIGVYDNGQLLNLIPDTARVYLSADTLIWTGKETADWHNINNWHNPNDPADLAPLRKTPRACTNVLIPRLDQSNNQISIYPDLSTTVTDYSLFSSALCNNITFEHGGEVLRSDLLTYSKAFVRLRLMSNRWYCFSPPLRDFYSGDIYETDSNPFLDEMMAYTRLFSQKDPQRNNYIEGSWSLTFNTPNYKFYPGQGLGVWLDDLDPDPTSRTEYNLSFPKLDAGYYIYNEDTEAPMTGLFPTSRQYAHRLIYEESINNATKDVPVKVSGPTVGEYVMVGNPFMSHVDFVKFYQANQTLIEDHYRIMESDGSYSTYSISGVSTGNPVLTAQISPMQSILVKPKAVIDPNVAARTLRFNVDMTVTKPGSTLRSGKTEKADLPLDQLADFMWVSISSDVLHNRSALVYNPDAKVTTSFIDNIDIFKLMRQGLKPTNVYFLTDEGYYMDIKQLSSLKDVTVKIGFASETKGAMSLGFERLWAFAGDHELFLEDKLLNKTIDLRQQSVYSFVKEDDELFTDDRFVLKFHRNTTGIEDVENTSSELNYTSTKGALEIFRVDGLSLGTVSVFDLQGREVASRKNVQDSRLGLSLSSGVYVVKVTDSNGGESLKVVVK